MAVKRKKRAQHTLSLKVSEEQKSAFRERSTAAGMSQSEMLEHLIFGRLPDEAPASTLLRDHLALVHQMRAALTDGMPIDRAALRDLTDASRALITAVRERLA